MSRAYSYRLWSLFLLGLVTFHLGWADDKFIVTDTWGSFGSNPGQFNLPFGLLTDPNLPPSLYVADALNNRVQVLDSSGNVTRIIKGRVLMPPNPADLAQWNGNLFVTDNGANAVEIFKESDGSEVGIIVPGVTANSGSPFQNPIGIAFDNLGALYVVDQFNYRVEKFNPTTGQLLTNWGSPCKLGVPNGTTLLPGGGSNNCVTPAGGSLGDGQFALPAGMAFAISDSTFQPMLLVVDEGNTRVEAFDTNGNFLFQFGSFGSGNGQFSDTGEIAVEWHCAPGWPRSACRSLIFVSDVGGRVEVFDTSGNFVTKFGLPAQPGGATPGTFQIPVGIAVPVNFPLDQMIYVADRGTNTIQRFVPMPDQDNDGILDVIDTDPTHISNDFSDGANNTGTIVDRGGQMGLAEFVVSEDISHKGIYNGNIRITTDPLGGPSPVVIKACGLQYFLSVNAGSSTLLKCGSATATVEVGKASVRFIGSDGMTVTSDLTAGQSLKLDPSASSATALAGTVQVYVNGTPFTLTAGQELAFPPVAGISITAPANGANLTDFDLKLFVTPNRGHSGHAELTPRVTVVPRSTISTDVTVSYSNTGGVANGTITLKEGGTVIGSSALTGARGTGVSTIPVNLHAGLHHITGFLTLTNSTGSSTASTTPVDVSVSDSFSVVDALKFDVAGATDVDYVEHLKYSIFQGDKRITEGELGASAASFTSLAVTVNSGQTLCLKERIHLKFHPSSLATVDVSATIGGRSHTESVSIQTYPWWHCPKWKIDEVPSGPCSRTHE